MVMLISSSLITLLYHPFAAIPWLTMISDDDMEEDPYCLDLPEAPHHPDHSSAAAGNSLAPSNVAHHYNSRPNQGTFRRQRSPIIHLREFNNWVKSVLIREFVSIGKLKALDLACGKGGDLHKWDRVGVSHVTGVDIAEISIKHAQERYETMRPKSFDAKFLAFDAFHKPWPDASFLPLRSYDAVSCQFAFHYSFASESSARTAISNVARILKHGGYFFGVIPDAREIRRRLLDPQHCKDKGRTIENQFYRIQMDEPVSAPHSSPFGIRYQFFLQDAIDTCPEFIVPFQTFARLCHQERLELVLEAPLPQFYDTYAKVPEYQELLHRMNIVSEEGLVMSENEREVAGLYLAFSFRRT